MLAQADLLRPPKTQASLSCLNTCMAHVHTHAYTQGTQGQVRRACALAPLESSRRDGSDANWHANTDALEVWKTQPDLKSSISQDTRSTETCYAILA